MKTEVLVRWARIMRGAKRRGYSMGLERGWHVSNRNMAFKRSMSENVTVKGVCVLDFFISERTQHVWDGCVRQVGCKHAARIFEIPNIMTLMSSAGLIGLVSWQRAMRDHAFNLASMLT